MPDVTTAEILQHTLDLIRADGWHPNGWGKPPWNIRGALAWVISHEDSLGSRPDGHFKANIVAVQAISQTIGKPLGLIGYWEMTPKRTQADVEKMLLKVIEGQREPNRRVIVRWHRRFRPSVQARRCRCRRGR